MSKKKKKKDKETLSLPFPGIISDNPDAIAKSCSRVLQECLGIDGVYLVGYNISKWKLLFLSKGGTGSRAYDKERERDMWVSPIYISSKGIYYWLSMYMVFIPFDSKVKLQQMGLIIFKGEAADYEKEPFFRAEWFTPDDVNNPHAQPHWHIYGSLIRPELFPKETIMDDFPAEMEEVKDFSEKIVAKTDAEEIRIFGETDSSSEDTLELIRETVSAGSNKFHFAMAASWHVDDEHQRYFNNERSLADWLRRCIGYIQHQLHHISS